MLASRMRQNHLVEDSACRHSRIIAAIREIPRGMVSTYGSVANAAGLTRGARQVGALLRHFSAGIPWHRVVGASGELKVRGNAAYEQRFQLEMEGVRFHGRRVDMQKFQFAFPSPRQPRLRERRRLHPPLSPKGKRTRKAEY